MTEAKPAEKAEAKPEVKTEAVKPQAAAVIAPATQAPAAHAQNAGGYKGGGKPRQMSSRPQRGRGRDRNRNEDGIDRKIVSIRRVSRTYSGGKRMRLSVVVVVGDGAGKVGVGIGKGEDVRKAEEKAYNRAKKAMMKINLRGTTIPHQVTYKKGAALVFMKPAAPGTGVIAGKAMRSVLEMVGVKDILTKVLGTNNSISNVYATLEALQQLKPIKTNVKPVK